MSRLFKCPKCRHTSKEKFDECPACGIILAKYLKVEEETKNHKEDHYVTTGDDSDNTKSGLLSKSWLLPLPAMLMIVWVLITSETIWGDDSNTVITLILVELIALPLVYLITFTPLFRALLGVATFFRSRPSDMEVGCAVGLIRAAILLLLYLNAFVFLFKF